MTNINMVFFFLVFSAFSFTKECFNICLDTSLSYLCYTRKRRRSYDLEHSLVVSLQTEYVERDHYSHWIEPIHQLMEPYPYDYRNQKSKILMY